jgi:adenine/guanine phosphoribosyltransferase-like PRPP-binding protein
MADYIERKRRRIVIKIFMPNEMPPNNPNYVNLPLHVRSGWQHIRDRAVSTAQLNKDILNYVVFSWANKPGTIDSVAEMYAANTVAYAFRNSQPTKILSIGNSGISFGNAVARNFPEAKVLTAIKSENSPDEKPAVMEKYQLIQAYSYSRKIFMWFYVPICTNERILVIDDVAAQGGIGVPLVKTIQELGNKVVGYGVFFDKVFQGGLTQIAKLGVPCFSSLRISEINHDHIKLMNESDSLQMIL